MSEGAKRFDVGKLRLGLIPTSFIEETAKVFTFGAQKYDDNNWRKGMKWSRCIDSLERHLMEFKKGNDNDEESGLLHLGHAAANIAFLIEFIKSHPELDDRYKQPIRRVGLDIDDVCASFVPAYCEKYNIELPTSWYIDYNFIPRAEELSKDQEFWLSLKPLFDPNKLNFEPVVYITARDPRLSEYTLKWLEMNNFPKAPVVYSRNKGEICNEYDLDIFIDDSPKNFREINKTKTACYLMNTKWNQHVNVGYRRINHVNEII